MSEHDTRQGFHLEVTQGRSLLQREIPDLRLREFDIA